MASHRFSRDTFRSRRWWWWWSLKLPLFHRKVRGSRDPATIFRPIPDVKVDQCVNSHLLKLEESQLLLVPGELCVEAEGVVEADLKEVHKYLRRPLVRSSGEGVVLQHLVEPVYPSHVVDVVLDGNRALKLSPLQFAASLLSDPFEMNKWGCSNAARVSD